MYLADFIYILRPVYHPVFLLFYQSHFTKVTIITTMKYNPQKKHIFPLRFSSFDTSPFKAASVKTYPEKQKPDKAMHKTAKIQISYI